MEGVAYPSRARARACAEADGTRLQKHTPRCQAPSPEHFAEGASPTPTTSSGEWDQTLWRA